MSVLTWIVTLASVASAGIMLGIGIWQENVYIKPVRAAATKAVEIGKEAVSRNADLLAEAEKVEKSEAPEALEAQSKALDAMGGTLEGVAKFAESLKDLDAATRAYLISVVFLLVATLGVSVGQFAG
ncbi:hypothetical protein [Streptomyces endophytica]|uniref:Uncharacterized protein n=1 Tax=Streptomyces endophytica TaxID=2991496 RepID=A0ABY6PAK3_9ACTN|nr:hypothetical protein [Streptomyces endophytica]UZJ30617.1 hypothetical protein OJ254_09930 [Streptomyces endophytica]